MEDVRKRINYEICFNEVRADKLLSHPAYKMRQIIKPETETDFGIVGVENIKSIATLNTPSYCGFTILELSNTHMQRFFYDTLKPFYGERVRLVYSDIDSFIWKLRLKMYMMTFSNLN